MRPLHHPFADSPTAQVAPLIFDRRAQIICEHEGVESCGTMALQHAIIAGEHLAKERDECKSDGRSFSRYCESLPFSRRTAYDYIKLWEGQEELCSALHNFDGPKSIREALKLLDAPEEPDPVSKLAEDGQARPITEVCPDYPLPKDKGHRLRHCEFWWDSFASVVLLYQANGRTVEWTAEYTGMPIEGVMAVWDPPTVRPEPDQWTAIAASVGADPQDLAVECSRIANATIHFQIGWTAKSAAWKARHLRFPDEVAATLDDLHQFHVDAQEEVDLDPSQSVLKGDDLILLATVGSIRARHALRIPFDMPITSPTIFALWNVHKAHFEEFVAEKDT